MSTYYNLGCSDCKKRGGFFSRQAWGVGNTDLIETFKFITWHTLNCGAAGFDVLSEHDDEYFENQDYDLLENARGYFPHSSDWTFMAQDFGEARTREIDRIWTEKELAEKSNNWRTRKARAEEGL